MIDASLRSFLRYWDKLYLQSISNTTTATLRTGLYSYVPPYTIALGYEQTSASQTLTGRTDPGATEAVDEITVPDNYLTSPMSAFR